MDREFLLHVVGFRAFIFDMYLNFSKLSQALSLQLSVQLQYSWEIKVFLRSDMKDFIILNCEF